MSCDIRPVENIGEFRAYIDAHWRKGHILAHHDAMFRFTYSTPWVDPALFTGGVSVLGMYERGRMVGFLGAIVAPYPRPQSYWLALWHVLPELKGGGHGGRLLQRMQEIAESSDGWIGTFGAGPEALPVYLKRGFCVRAGRRWVFDPHDAAAANALPPRPVVLHSAEQPPSDKWFAYRYQRHPIYRYDVRPHAVIRTETNPWGVVTHVCWLDAAAPGASDSVADACAAGSAQAARAGRQHVVDCWAFDCPGPGWKLAPAELPSVFHPVEARGNVTYAVGRPFLFSSVHKGDCDQDRPNFDGAPRAAPAAASAT